MCRRRPARRLTARSTSFAAPALSSLHRRDRPDAAASMTRPIDTGDASRPGSPASAHWLKMTAAEPPCRRPRRTGDHTSAPAARSTPPVAPDARWPGRARRENVDALEPARLRRKPALRPPPRLSKSGCKSGRRSGALSEECGSLGPELHLGEAGKDARTLRRRSGRPPRRRSRDRTPWRTAPRRSSTCPTRSCRETRPPRSPRATTLACRTRKPR